MKTTLGKKILEKLAFELKVLIPIGALLLFLLNASITKDSFTKSKESFLSSDKKRATSVKAISDQLLFNNQFSMVEKLVEETMSGSNTFAEEVAFNKILKDARTRQQEETQTQRDFVTWNKIASNQFFYRDAYIKLAILAWKTNRTFEVRKNINQAFTLDPNFEVTIRLLENLSRL